MNFSHFFRFRRIFLNFERFIDHVDRIFYSRWTNSFFFFSFILQKFMKIWLESWLLVNSAFCIEKIVQANFFADRMVFEYQGRSTAVCKMEKRTISWRSIEEEIERLFLDFRNVLYHWDAPYTRVFLRAVPRLHMLNNNEHDSLQRVWGLHTLRKNFYNNEGNGLPWQKVIKRTVNQRILSRTRITRSNPGIHIEIPLNI